MTSTPCSSPTAQRLSDANRLGLDYAAEAASFSYPGPIIDIHTHISSPASAAVYLDVAARFGVVRTWTMTGLEKARRVRGFAGDRIEFICVPDYAKRDEPGTFTTQWLRDIEAFRAELGSRIIKFWAAPRGLDLAGGPDSPLRLDSPIRLEGMKLAYDLGYRVFMTHVGDPDTWFATTYADATKYGTKSDQFVALERLMDQYDDVTWIGAHMSGNPEDLDFVQGLLDRHPNYLVDTSATKWMVRELSKHPQRFAEFCRANPGRVLFGTDIVANDENVARQPGDDEHKPDGFDLYASRYWALRTLLETGYDGPSPIVDPDLQLIDPSTDPKSTATLRGCGLSGGLLGDIYYHNAAKLLGLVE